MAKISKETNVCISIAEKPSNFGTTLFNEAFAATDLDFIYKAFGVKPDEDSLRDAINGIKALGIRGCGVSMPFKVMAVKILRDLGQDLDQSVTDVGALNTISNEGGRLKGYNTDYYGAREVLSSIESIREKSVLILGAGGVSLAITAALRSLDVGLVTITNRTEVRAHEVAAKWGYRVVAWEQRHLVGANILINATSIGMSPNVENLPYDPGMMSATDIFMDVIVSPARTRFIQIAEAMGKRVIPGYEMSLYQAMAQYKIYTGQDAPVEVMEETMKKLLGL